MKPKAKRNMGLVVDQLDPDEKIPSNYQLRRATKERLVRAKRRLNCSETACIEAALRLWFDKEGIE